jgi:hypothetical protein
MLLEHKLPQLMTTQQQTQDVGVFVPKAKQLQATGGSMNGTNAPVLANGTNGYHPTNGHL